MNLMMSDVIYQLNCNQNNWVAYFWLSISLLPVKNAFSALFYTLQNQRKRVASSRSQQLPGLRHYGTGPGTLTMLTA